jgi:hypothetical protein
VATPSAQGAVALVARGVTALLKPTAALGAPKQGGESRVSGL